MMSFAADCTAHTACVSSPHFSVPVSHLCIFSFSLTWKNTHSCNCRCRLLSQIADKLVYDNDMYPFPLHSLLITIRHGILSLFPYTCVCLLSVNEIKITRNTIGRSNSKFKQVSDERNTSARFGTPEWGGRNTRLSPNKPRANLSTPLPLTHSLRHSFVIDVPYICCERPKITSRLLFGTQSRAHAFQPSTPKTKGTAFENLEV
jgi:hypothetical protein